MFIKLDAHMQSFGDDKFLAWIEAPKKFKMVVEAASPEEAAKELLISLKVAMSHIFGIPVESIQHKQVSYDEELYNDIANSLKLDGHKELKLQIAS